MRSKGAAPNKVTWELEPGLEMHQEALECYWVAKKSRKASTNSVWESVMPRQDSTSLSVEYSREDRRSSE